jgi:hypothetical protein
MESFFFFFFLFPPIGERPCKIQCIYVRCMALILKMSYPKFTEWNQDECHHYLSFVFLTIFLECIFPYCLISSPACFFLLWITSEQVRRKSDKMENLPPLKKGGSQSRLNCQSLHHSVEMSVWGSWRHFGMSAQMRRLNCRETLLL